MKKDAFNFFSVFYAKRQSTKCNSGDAEKFEGRTKNSGEKEGIQPWGKRCTNKSANYVKNTDRQTHKQTLRQTDTQAERENVQYQQVKRKRKKKVYRKRPKKEKTILKDKRKKRELKRMVPEKLKSLVHPFRVGY